MKKVLLLTKDKHPDLNSLKTEIESHGAEVFVYTDKIYSDAAAFSPQGLSMRRVSLDQFDLVLSYFYGHIIPSNCLGKIKNGVNCHISLLPDGAGSQPNVWAILNEKGKTGVTIHKLSADVDRGDIIAQKPVSIKLTDTGYDLYNRLCKDMLKLTCLWLPELIANDYTTISQYTPGEYLPSPRTTGEFHMLRDLNSRFLPEELDSITEFLDIARACSFNNEHKGAYIRRDGKRIYINNITLVEEDDD
jgi:methionyl-tRNA formyltransferase